MDAKASELVQMRQCLFDAQKRCLALVEPGASAHEGAPRRQTAAPLRKRSQPDALRAGLGASGRPAMSAQESLRVSSETPHPARHGGQSATIENSRAFSPNIAKWHYIDYIMPY